LISNIIILLFDLGHMALADWPIAC